jgi:molybdate-binding protein
LEQNTTGIKYSQNSKEIKEIGGTYDTYRDIITRQRRTGKRTIHEEILRDRKKKKNGRTMKSSRE